MRKREYLLWAIVILIAVKIGISKLNPNWDKMINAKIGEVVTEIKKALPKFEGFKFDFFNSKPGGIVGEISINEVQDLQEVAVKKINASSPVKKVNQNTWRGNNYINDINSRSDIVLTYDFTTATKKADGTIDSDYFFDIKPLTPDSRDIVNSEAGWFAILEEKFEVYFAFVIYSKCSPYFQTVVNSAAVKQDWGKDSNALSFSVNRINTERTDERTGIKGVRFRYRGVFYTFSTTHPTTLSSLTGDKDIVDPKIDLSVCIIKDP